MKNKTYATYGMSEHGLPPGGGLAPDSLASSPGSPLRLSRSRQEMIEEARQFMRQKYPPENTAESADRWCERFGLLVDFVTEIFPEENT